MLLLEHFLFWNKAEHITVPELGGRTGTIPDTKKLHKLVRKDRHMAAPGSARAFGIHI